MKLHNTSRISRRLGERFFFKAARDSSPKAAMVRRPYPPGMHGKARRRSPSEFGISLREKQKVRFLYGLSDAALKRTVREARGAPGQTATHALVAGLERRLDNVVYRLGIAVSRRIARQLVAHGHILVNGRKVRIASYRVRAGDRVSVRPGSLGRPPLDDLSVRLAKHQPPVWLSLEAEEATGPSGKVRALPGEDDGPTGQNLSKVIEYYSR